MALPKYRRMEVEVPSTVKTSHRLILGGLLLALVCLFEMYYDVLVESYNTKTKSFRDVMSIFKTSTAEDEDIIDHQRDGRTEYGYLHPTPPYKPVIRTSHTCNITTIKNNETIQEVVHLPLAIPHLILIGVQKSGTSSFQSMIDKRINVTTPLSVNKFEPHFFDFRVMKVLKKYNDHTTMVYKSKVCEKRKQYTEYFNMTKVIPNNESVAIEKTPSYILYSNLPWMIDEVCPWAKIAVILRSLVDRAWSGYRMKLGSGKKKKKKNVTAFSTLVKEEIDEFIKYGLLNNSTQSLDEFEASLNHTANTTFEDDISSPFVFPSNMTLDTYAQLVYNYEGKRGGLLFRGLYAPLLIPWVQQFAADDRLMILRFSDLHSKPNETVDEVLGFAGVNDTSIDEDYIIPKRIRKNPDMKGKDISLDPTLRLYLNLLYRPINKLLAELLGDDWQGVWA